MKKVVIIGMGNMGLAIREQLQDNFQVSGVGREGDLSLVHSADIVIIAVKPQSFPELSSVLRSHVHDGQVVISIMAGVTIRHLTDTLGIKRVVRTMPNLALKTGQSMTAWYSTTKDIETETKAVLDAWGQSVRLEREEQFDAFTALAGSGPAYYFELAYLLEKEAVRQGFSMQDARRISLQTFRGAASILESSDSVEDLVHKVASKGGTTEAALTVFREHSFERMITSVIEAACERSRKLGLSLS